MDRKQEDTFVVIILLALAVLWIAWNWTDWQIKKQAIIREQAETINEQRSQKFNYNNIVVQP